MPVVVAYLSLGSNLGNRDQNLLRASAELVKGGVQVLRSSSIYETDPQDVADQPAFLNCVLEVQSHLAPFPLLRLTQDIETAMGRTPSEAPKGPRLIDIDILLLGEFVIQDERLTIPHPRMLNRRFVLEPLLELVPDLRCPGTGAVVRDLLDSVREQGVRPVGKLPCPVP